LSKTGGLGPSEERTAPFLANRYVYSETACPFALIVAITGAAGRAVARFSDCAMKAGQKSAILFTICAFLFILHQYLQKIAGISLPLVDSYLDPLLCMPILMHLIVWERKLLHRWRIHTLPLLHIAGYFLLISILCEIVFPIWNQNMTADPWDIAFYALGGFIYISVATPYLRKSAGQAYGD